MSSFPTDSKSQKNKYGLGSDQNTKKTIGPINFVKQCNMIELFVDIDRDLWIDDIILGLARG